MDTIKKVANAILDAGEGCQSGLVYVDPVEAAKAAVAVLSAEVCSYNAGFNDGWEAANGEPPESALSTDAEPVAWQARRDPFQWGNIDAINIDIYREKGYEIRPLYAAPPAPSIAVKALEWKEDGKYLRARMGDREYSINITADGETWAGATRPYAFGKNLTWSSVPNCSMVSLETAKAACQADCQSRYAALSAQVQDVAGLSKWQGWDKSNLPWSEAKHKDAVCYAAFGEAWSMNDAAALIGFIDRTWTAAPAAKLEGKP